MNETLIMKHNSRVSFNRKPQKFSYKHKAYYLFHYNRSSQIDYHWAF